MSPTKPHALALLLGIRHPILQGGMTWVSRHALAAAVSEAGALGVLGSGGMEPEELRSEIRALRTATARPFAVNVPLVNVRPDGDDTIVERLVEVVCEERVGIVVTSAGSPARYTARLAEGGALVVHVVPSVELARKAEAAGVDAIVAESTEAGGHVSAGGLSTFSLLPQVVDAVGIPVIAAGGIADARGVVAALALGAAGVQVGTRFIATLECNAHASFKRALVAADAGGSVVYSRAYHPSRALATRAVARMVAMEAAGATSEEIVAFRGRGRAQAGCVDGDLEEGILPAGSAVGLVRDVTSARGVVEELVSGCAGVVEALRGACSDALRAAPAPSEPGRDVDGSRAA